MTLTPEIEATGLKAYEQARAFERLRSWRLPLSYGMFALVPALSGAEVWRYGQAALAGLDFLAALLLAWAAWLHWRRLRARYAKNLRVLAEMEGAYGGQLPWIKVEHHFAALEKLQRELAEKRSGGKR